MPTRQREYRTRRSFRVPHLEQDALSDSSSAPQEAQRCGSTLVGVPHMEQYTLSDGSSTPQEAQRIDSFSAGCSLNIREHCTMCSRTCAAFLLRVWGYALRTPGVDSPHRGNDGGRRGNREIHSSYSKYS